MFTGPPTLGLNYFDQKLGTDEAEVQLTPFTLFFKHL